MIWYDFFTLRISGYAQGIAPVSDLSAEQVEALAGGPLLQQEVINLGASQTPAKALSKTSKWLVAALQNVRTAPLVCMLTLCCWVEYVQ